MRRRHDSGADKPAYRSAPTSTDSSSGVMAAPPAARRTTATPAGDERSGRQADCTPAARTATAAELRSKRGAGPGSPILAPPLVDLCDEAPTRSPSSSPSLSSSTKRAAARVEEAGAAPAHCSTGIPARPAAAYDVALRDGSSGSCTPPYPMAPRRTQFSPASPQVWPAFSDAGTELRLPEFTTTHAPANARGAGALTEAPRGSAVAAIRSQPVDVHPSAREAARRQSEGRLAYPSRLTVGYGLGGGSGVPGSPTRLSQAGSLYGVSGFGAGAGSAGAGAGAGQPLTSSPMGLSWAPRPLSGPSRGATEGFQDHAGRRLLPMEGWSRRQERQRARAERLAATREDTYAALTRSHHVPLVPFSTTVDPAVRPTAAPTREEAVACFSAVGGEVGGTGAAAGGGGGYGSASGEAGRGISAPARLQRALTREVLRPASPALNASGIGIGGRVTTRAKGGRAVFDGATRYFFGRRAGGGPMGGGRSAFLRDEDPSQSWTAQLSSQAQLHLDPLFPEELFITDVVDDTLTLPTSSTPRGGSMYYTSGAHLGSRMSSVVADSNPRLGPLGTLPFNAGGMARR